MQERRPGRKCRRRQGLPHSQECPGGSNVPKSISSQTIIIISLQENRHSYFKLCHEKGKKIK